MNILSVPARAAGWMFLEWIMWSTRWIGTFRTLAMVPTVSSCGMVIGVHLQLHPSAEVVYAVSRVYDSFTELRKALGYGACVWWALGGGLVRTWLRH